MNNKTIRRELSAYFTVEASMIVPLVFVLIMQCIFLVFFLYNHCVIYQSCYIAALRGQLVKEVSNSGIEKYVDEELAKLLDEQIYRYQINGKASVSAMTISVEAHSGFENILRDFNLYNINTFEIKRGAKVTRINPTEFVRKSHNLLR